MTEGLLVVAIVTVAETGLMILIHTRTSTC
jgi:hypothetical protein